MRRRRVAAAAGAPADRSWLYVALSALHKEVRRGDVGRALYWAREVARFRGSAGVKQYVRRILFEETHNVRLFFAWERDYPVLGMEHMVEQITSSRKKWEQCGMKGLYDIVVKARMAAPRLQPIEDAELRTPPRADRHEFYNWHLKIARARHRGRLLFPRKSPELLQEYRRTGRIIGDILAEALSADGHKLEAKLLRRRCGTYELSLGIETLVGLRDQSADEFSVVSNMCVADAEDMAPPDYVFDAHCVEGRRRLSKIKLKRGEPTPGVDLRWSGVGLGIYWRYAAFAQYGLRYKTVRWERVVIPPQIWSFLTSRTGGT